MPPDIFGQYGGYIAFIMSSCAATFGFTWRFFVVPLQKRVEVLEAEVEAEKQFRIKIQARLLDLKVFSQDERP